MPKNFDGYRTDRLMAVARAVTPVDAVDNWTLTAWGRVWRREGDGWTAVSALSGQSAKEYGYQVFYLEDDLREFVIEMLGHYGVQPDSWQMEAH